jgi:hypothetical protein
LKSEAFVFVEGPLGKSYDFLFFLVELIFQHQSRRVRRRRRSRRSPHRHLNRRVARLKLS